jgi:hypothetical protein
MTRLLTRLADMISQIADLEFDMLYDLADLANVIC